MRILIIGAALAAFVAAAAPALGLERVDNIARAPDLVAPGLQYTVTGRDGATVTVVEGQPRWSAQRRRDERLVPGGDIGAIVNILNRVRGR